MVQWDFFQSTMCKITQTRGEDIPRCCKLWSVDLNLKYREATRACWGSLSSGQSFGFGSSQSDHVVPDEGEIMALLSLPVLAAVHSHVCVCFQVLQPVQDPHWRTVRGAKAHFTPQDNIPSNWLSHGEWGSTSTPTPTPPVDFSLASSSQLLQMTDATILWEMAGLSCCGRQSVGRLSENSMKQIRGNKEKKPVQVQRKQRGSTSAVWFVFVQWKSI